MKTAGTPAFFHRRDLAIIAGLLALALAIWLIYTHWLADPAPCAEISYRSQPIMTVPLDRHEDRLFSAPGHPNVVFHLYADGTIAFAQSDCPDKVCVNTGRIGIPGQFAACLPNELVLKILPGKANDPDVPDLVTGS